MRSLRSRRIVARALLVGASVLLLGPAAAAAETAFPCPPIPAGLSLPDGTEVSGGTKIPDRQTPTATQIPTDATNAPPVSSASWRQPAGGSSNAAGGSGRPHRLPAPLSPAAEQVERADDSEMLLPADWDTLVGKGDAATSLRQAPRPESRPLSRRPPRPTTVSPPTAERHDIASLNRSSWGEVRNAFDDAPGMPEQSVRLIPAYESLDHASHRIVRYEIPLDDDEMHEFFQSNGVPGRLVEVADEAKKPSESISDRLKSFWRPNVSRERKSKVRMVRYEVPAEDIYLHTQLSDLDGDLLEPGMLRVPEVRFFQPKARIFIDLKQSNDNEFDLFNDGAILASLDVIELYFPMPLISERFAELFGKPGRLSSIGWRVGGTVGLGLTTALNNGSSANGSAPVSTLAAGIRYEFPLGRPSRELVETGDPRIDQRTRVGMEFGIQGGLSTRESLGDATDLGLYFGILVNTPWGS